MENLPPHLRRYVVEQNYGRYSSVDQAVWRFILRQLRAFLSQHAHESYLDGLEKTGIDVERIPHIDDISEKLSHFGWRAVPVSGFIPPAAFMELQALSVLPIASDLRTLDHLLYTPAPDIVHEAAGHAPILANPEFAQYLKDYAQVAKRAILSREDLDQYEAIRALSDLKEHPDSTEAQVQAAQTKLDQVSKSITNLSEAAELSRMNWWTAEYGLIGSLKDPKIFGAGLLSSVGESKWCLSDQVKKIPLTVDCIKVPYDITEPQPQLFVTPDFKTLSKVLNEFAARMSFRRGGLFGLRKALLARTINSAQWSSGLQAGGELAEVIESPVGTPAYLRFQGPTQLAFADKQLEGHGKSYHAEGFGSPVGPLQGESKDLSQFSDSELLAIGLIPGSRAKLTFASGFVVEGLFEKSLRREGHLLLLTFKDAKVTWGERVLFEPAWGPYDMAVGGEITSVFGGPPDREAFGETEDFVAARIPERRWTDNEIFMQGQYDRLRKLREEKLSGDVLVDHVDAYLMTHDKHFPQDWLFRIEALELILNRGPSPRLETKLRQDLARLQEELPASKSVIVDGLNLADRI